jgi:hypothetical protein
MMPDCQYAFRILGSPKGGKRHVIDAASALYAYAKCDTRCQLERESYTSAFLYGQDFRQHVKERGTTEAFDGVCWNSYLYFDIDREADLQAALFDTRKLCSSISRLYQVPPEAWELFFSGGKGFHAGLSTALWKPIPSRSFHLTARAMAETLARQAGVIIDTAIYAKVQPFRFPNSRHGKTGLYKRHLSYTELAEWTIESIIDAARKPHPFTIATTNTPCKRLRVVWSDSETASKPLQVHSRSPVSRLNRATLDFIQHGAASGERHTRLFSASANLAEFGCSAKLAHALLTEAATDSGLPPAEVRRLIECGVRKGGG